MSAQPAITVPLAIQEIQHQIARKEAIYNIFPFWQKIYLKISSNILPIVSGPAPDSLIKCLINVPDEKRGLRQNKMKCQAWIILFVYTILDQITCGKIHHYVQFT
jgi:hypothetical protein